MRRAIVVGTSAGGPEALQRLVSRLPADLGCPVFVVMHLSRSYDSQLAHILDRAGPLRAFQARGSQKIVPGRIYVAPPDRHLVIDRGMLRTVHGLRENMHRPSIDPLFRTAAVEYRSGLAAVLMTGLLDDGVSGLLAVKMRGGLALVQDPRDAAHPDMPLNALRYVPIDASLPVEALAERLAGFCRGLRGPIKEARHVR